jgi:hypothetical protein
MELIAVPCDHDHYLTVKISQWLHDNVGLMAPEKALIDSSAPWHAHHYVMVPSIYYFINEADAIMFKLKWS